MGFTRRFALAVAVGTLLGAGVGQAAGQGHVTVDVGARDPAISPDGSTIAVSILGKIWTMPIEGGAATQFTYGATWDTRPAWSPHGRFLAYGSRTGAGAELVVRTLATGGTRFLHHVPGSIGHIEFSPNGDQIYFVDQRSQYDAHVWRIPVAGGEAEPLTHTRNWHEWTFALTPDGKRLLVASGRYEGTDIYEIGLEDGALDRVTNTRERESSLVVSRDGSKHAYVETFNGIDHIVVTEAGAAPRRVAASPFDQKQLAFAPDGSWLLVAGGRRLHRLDLDSGAMRDLPFEARFTIAAAPTDDLVLTDVRLFDGTGTEAVPSRTVVVRDGRIREVLGDGAVPDVPAGTPVIDGRGRTLLPGLMDNHYHYWEPLSGADLLAAGVTSIRDPGSRIADAMDYKDAIRLGILSGPDVYAAGPLIDGPGGYHPWVDVNIDDPAAAAPLVRSLEAQGVDFLKVYFLLDPAVLAAVVDEAKVQHLPVTGHIGVRTSWNEAIDGGISGLDHIRIWHDFLPVDQQPDGRAESLDSGRNPIGRMQANWTSIDPESPEVSALLERMADTRTALDPTLYIQHIDDEAKSRFSLEEFAAARKTFTRMQTFVRRAVEAGVPLLAGTDNAGLFNELEVYDAAGVPTYEILRAATVNGARWLGKDADFGTIEPGKRAHMILVDGDPLEDISRLRDIDLVVKDGVIVFER